MALIARGQHDDAEQVFGKVLDAAPYHRDALNFLATRAYGRGDLLLCVTLLERAVQAKPDDAVVQENLAVAYLDSGKFAEAAAQFDRVLELRPGDVDATLYKGFLLERIGQPTDAVEHYARACIAVGNIDAYLHSALNPARMKELLRGAVDTVMRELRRLIAENVAPLRQRHQGADFSRVDACIEGFVGGRRDRPDALQRPSLLYFPGLATKPFYERAELPAVKSLEEALPEVLAEYLALQGGEATFSPYVQAPGHQDPQQWRELNNSPAWSAYHLYRNSERLADACETCPETARLVETLPLARITGHAPEIFFSILKPGTHIPPHFGLGNYKLAVHLPLVLPGSCAIRVGNETREWQEGQCLIFDDSFQHEAWNRSGSPRVVLILDVWHPALEEHERAAICGIHDAIAAFRQRYGMEFFKT
ncbi:MAG TPA: aspartyl/asparaginyl beta-hydroxylase domain-containing protein [Gammaproteobacteria bacterium]|nr:aspartyl/asparaginyl beta-hydroxylase domain-containing protein [Gammaproteobacteria bacterium]